MRKYDRGYKWEWCGLPACKYTTGSSFHKELTLTLAENGTKAVLREVSGIEVFSMVARAEVAIATMSEQGSRTSVNGLPHTNVTVSFRQTNPSSSTKDFGHSCR